MSSGAGGMHGSTSLPHGTVKIVIDGNLLRGGHLRFVGDICGELIWFHRCEAPRQDSRLIAGQVSDEPWSGPAIR